MQNVGREDDTQPPKDEQNVEVGQASLTPSSPVMEKAQVLAAIQQNFMELSADEEEDVSEVESFILEQDDLEEDAEPVLDTSKFLLSSENMEGADLRTVDPETQARLEALLEAAGIGKLSRADGKAYADPEVLRQLTTSVSSALDEAAAALTRMRAEQQGQLVPADSTRSLAEACSDGDIGTVRKLLDEGRSVHETTEEGESLLSLACSAGYYELAQVLLAMRANVEDRGIKGDCTPLMEAASGGYVDIVRLLIAHGADVNAQSSAGNTPLHYAACGGYEDVVRVLIEAGANVEEHNENGHTPLMEAASAGHVGMARILLAAGAGINTHSNEFKESALTLACYKGHLEMVQFLLEAGADREHKTDEMHTALMEASMDGHVEVARLLLDSGAQVNMPADSFESPLTLAACGGHVELANLLIERGANLEEVNDEGYTPLMEAAREGHEEMVALLLAHGADINAQTEETQETALTLACCGGFLEVADFLIKAGADIELGCSTPLMEAAQEGHLELVKYLLNAGANVHAQTGTGDTALTYACENGHTDVADILLQHGAELEHESEGGRTPLMKAARAGHLCTVQFLISKGADVNRQTSTNDHTVLSLAAAGGHLGVVELLLAHGADPTHRLKDGSTMLIEAAKGGHTSVVNLLLDYPNSVLSPTPDLTQLTPPDTQLNIADLPRVPMQGLNNVVPPQDPDQVPISTNNFTTTTQQASGTSQVPGQVNLKDLNIPTRTSEQIRQNMQKSLTSTLRPNQRLKEGQLPETKQPKNNLTTMPDIDAEFGYDYEKNYNESESPVSLDLDLKAELKASEKCERLETFINTMMRKAELLNATREEQIMKKQQILEELQKVERELQEKAQAQLLLNLQHHQQQKQQPPPPPDQVQAPDPAAQTLQINPPDIKPEGTSLNNNNHEGPDCKSHPHNGDLIHNGAGEGANEGEEQERPRHIAKQESIGSIDSTSSSEANPMAKVPRLGPTDGAEADSSIASSSGCGEVKADFTDTSSSVGDGAATSDNHSSRASSEEVDLSNVVPAAEATQQQQQQLQQQQLQQQQLKLQQQQLQQLQQQALLQTVAKAASGQGGELPASAQALLSDPETLQQLQSIPLQTVLEQSVAAATSTAAALDQQHVQLQQQRQQLQAQLALQQQLQAELQQQLKLKQEHQQLQQQLKAKQIDLQTMKHQDQLQQVQQFQLQPPPVGGVQPTAVEATTVAANQPQQPQPQQPQPVPQPQPQLQPQQQFTLQQLQAQQQIHAQQQVAVTPFLQTTQQQQQQQLQQLKLHQVQQQLAQVQQLQSNQQLTQQELLQQAQQLQEQLQLAQLAAQQQQKQQHQLTQQELLQQAQQLQQQLHAQQLQQLAQQQQQQKQLTHFQGTQPKKVKKKHPVTMTQQQPPLVAPPLNTFPVANNLQAGSLDTITPPPSTPLTPNPSPASPSIPPPVYPAIDLDAQTESNHDTALTLACAGGHAELVSLLLSRGADIEHRDKKGFTPLILAATAGHSDVVEILLDHGADIEAQSERTKDTPLSLACSGGRYEVVELLLGRGANKEHRNVSDYTPLSLAASGGYVNIIKLLLSHGAEINSRTGSKLGISPLMLAAMNGHTAAVKLLLDMGSDINAQIETNRNTALTLACFQGRHEVVSLLVDRRANIEHRAKTGLTPLMEAASGGYVEVGRVLLDKGADVNAPPVPSSRDTALTIAADKGHYRFVELLLTRGAAVDVKNKKGNSPLWLACNGGHLDVVQLLVNAGADIDSQDNRKVSCLMSAFRKGHIKVVKWMVKHVMQFPSDPECMRYIATITDKELLKKCHQCMEIIVSAKDRQAAEANKNASILLEQLDMERSREESKRAANARKREKRRKKKKEKQEKEQRQKDTTKNSSEPEDDDNKTKEEQEGKSEERIEDDDDDEDDTDSGPSEPRIELPLATATTTIGSTINADSRPPSNKRAKNDSNSTDATTKTKNRKNRKADRERSLVDTVRNVIPPSSAGAATTTSACSTSLATTLTSSSIHTTCRKKKSELASTSGIGDLDVFGPPSSSAKSPREKDRHRKSVERTPSKSNSIDTFSAPLLSPGKASISQGGLKSPNVTSPKRGQKKEEGWKEVIRKPSVGSRSKRVTVPSSAISRVIGRGGCNINAIREVSGAHIEVDKQKGSGDRVITMKGSTDATHQAHTLISALIKDPDKELEQILPKLKNRLLSSANNTLSSSNMWHNSMANGIGTTTVTSQSTASPIVSHKSHGKTGGSTVRLSTTMGAALVSTPGTNISIRSSLAGGTPRMGITSAATGIPQGPIQVWKPAPMATISGASSPKRAHPSSNMGGMIAVCGPPPAKSQPSTVARQLFPGEQKPSSQIVSTSAKTTVTYSTVSTSKTKVVMSTSSTFASKVDNIGMIGSTKPSQIQSPNPNGNKLSSTPGFLGNKSDLQPLPIKSGTGQGMSQGGKQIVGGSVPLPPGVPGGTPAEYSPFNNLFSQVAEQVLGKKEDLQGDGRKNFATVAAAGVIPPNSQGPCSSPVTVSAPEEQDPNLQAKAPGYKGPGQRTSSPQLNEQDLARAPGYRVRPPINFDQMDPHQMIAFMTSMGMVHAGQPFLEGDPNRAPGYKGHISAASPGGGHGPETNDPARAPGYKPSNSQQGSQANLSPRSSSSTPGMGGFSPNVLDPHHHLQHQQLLLGPLQNLHIRDEYSTPNQPMTLPKIESTLNPNAPNFTSRSIVPPHPGQQLPPGQINPPHGFNATQPLAPNIGPQPGFRAPPPPGVIGQPTFNSLAQANPNFLSQAAALLPGDLNSLASLMNHPAMMGAQGTIPAAMPRQFNPQTLLSRPASTPAMGASKEDSPLAPVSSEASPASSSAPSPTDQMKPGDDRRLLRPIGTERAHKKPPAGAGYPGAMGDGAATGLWSFSTDLGSDWMSSVSTVMTTSATSSTILTPGLAAEGEERPPSHPAIASHLVPGTFTLDPGAMDQPTDHTFQAQALLLSSSGGAPLFANGVPAAAAAALPSVATVYPQPTMGGDAGPSMWNQQVKMPPTDPNTDSKMWNNWTPPPNM